MNEGARYVSFRDYLQVARERWVLVVVITLLFGGAALATALNRSPSYAADTSLNFQDPQAQASLFGVNQNLGGETADQRAAAGATTVTSPDVLDRAAKILKLKSNRSLFDKLSGRPEAKTNFVIVEARAGTADQAVRVANAVAQATVDVTRDHARATYRQAADVKSKVRAKLKGPQYIYARIQLSSDIARLNGLARAADPVSIEDPASDAGRVGPGTIVITLIGLLIGLTIGLVAAFVRDSLDRRYKSSQELTDELSLPILGYVPERLLGRSTINGKRRRSLSQADFDAFRILRTNIEFLRPDEPPQLILVTSALPEEGKSTVSTALAVAYALIGKRTLLVESDMRRPTLAQRVGVSPQPGLTDYLTGGAEPRDVVQVVPWTGLGLNGDGTRPLDARALAVIVAGATSSQASELLRSARADAFFDQIKQAYDVVIVDCPPLLSVADTREVMPASDTVIVCVRASQTTREQARAARTALERLPERLGGIVLTGVRAPEATPYYHY